MRDKETVSPPADLRQRHLGDEYLRFRVSQCTTRIEACAGPFTVPCAHLYRSPTDRRPRACTLPCLRIQPRCTCCPASRADRQGCPTRAPAHDAMRQRITSSDNAQTAARHVQRRNPTVTKIAKIRLRQSSHRHGNCMNCIFGSTLQKSAVTGEHQDAAGDCPAQQAVPERPALFAAKAWQPPQPQQLQASPALRSRK